jgi:hypothetical protein
MTQRNQLHRGLVLVAMGAMIAGGCARRDRPPVATAAPSGRGQRVPSVPLPKSWYGPKDKATAGQQRLPEPIKTFDEEFPSTTTAPAAKSVGFVGRTATVYLKQGMPALGSGPRHDVVKGTVKTIDADWLVVVTTDGKRTLYIPRSNVLVIEQD